MNLIYLNKESIMSNVTELKIKENNQESAFQNPEHAFTELFKLLPQLHTTQNTEVLKAIITHASNSLESILGYSQSLGSILAIAVQEQEIGADREELADGGWLIGMLSNMAKGCCQIKTMAEFELAKRKTAEKCAYAAK